MKFSRKHLLLLISAAFIGSAAFAASPNLRAVSKIHEAKPSHAGNPSVSPAITTTPSPISSASANSSTPAPSAPASASQPSKSQNPSSQAKATPAYIPPPAWPPPVSFTAGRVQVAYTSCSSGALSYTLGGVSIYVNQATSTPFSWRIEASDGTVSESGTDVMPTGQTSWSSFPSTPDYPSMLGTIINADDGDMARLVITSPNYSAGEWSTAIPAGSKAACRNGQM